jgi:hypothetical protein
LIVAIIIGTSAVVVICVVAMRSLAVFRARARTSDDQLEELEFVRIHPQAAGTYDEDPILYYV